MATDSTSLNALLKAPAGKNAVVVGAGKTGAAAAALLMRLGARVVVVDDASSDKVRDAVARDPLFAGNPLPEIHGGGINADLVYGADMVVLSPGVPRAHPALSLRIEAGLPIVNELELAAAHVDAGTQIVGITGTNGKSTTTTMCGEIARAVDPDAFVGGNLGTPWSAAVARGWRGRIAVLELSSYQLETIRTLRLAAAILTNLTPDHLDRYPDVGAYYAAKLHIFDLLAPQGFVALNAADPQSRAVAFAALAQRDGRTGTSHLSCHFDVSKGEEGIEIHDDQLVIERSSAVSLRRALPVQLALSNVHIVGRHNRANAAAAVAAGLALGIAPEAIQRGLNNYSGIAHRLEQVADHSGVRWFNDSKATNVDAAVTALRSFAGGVHLIAGGLGKGAPYAPLVEAARGRVAAVYTIGQDAPAIAAAFAGVCDIVDCKILTAACAQAAAQARPGDVILLSPACASFDQFKDYADRGEQFKTLARAGRGAP